MGIAKMFAKKGAKKIIKESLDSSKSSPRSAIVQAQKYKAKQSGLQKEFDKTLKSYKGLKDKDSEKGLLCLKHLS